MVVNDETKSFICRLYDNKLYPSIKAMAKAAGVSTRTFNRVLVATGRATKQMAAQDEARAYLKVLLKHGIESPKALDQTLTEWADGQGRLFKEKDIQKATVSLPAGSTDFMIGVVNDASGAAIAIDQRLVDGTIVNLYSNFHGMGESVAAFDIQKTTLTKESVLDYLNAQSVDVLAGLFYASGLVKIAESYNTSVMNGTLKHQQAARAVKPEQKVSYAPQPGYKQA